MNLDLHRKKLSVAIVLGTLALSALFLARGTTSLVASSLLPVSAAPALQMRAGQTQQPPGTQPPDRCALLKRNIFDPQTGALCPPKPTEVPEAEQAEAGEPPQELTPGQMPPPCEGSSLKLVASVHSDHHPEWSFVTVSNGSAAPMLYREGGRVDDKEVVAIYPKAVFFRQGNGHFCSLTLFAPPPGAAGFSGHPVAPQISTPVAPPPAVGAVASRLSGAGSITEQELNQNITAVSDTKFNVQRGFVDKVLQNQGEIMRSARIVPHEENGQVVGVKLYGIRRNSLLGKLGLQNGDLLRTINGFDMASPDSALEAYARLRSANNLSVAVTRRGKPMAVEYDIVGSP